MSNILTFLIGTARITNSTKLCTPTATKHAYYANFTYVHEKVILLGRSRLRALVVLVFTHDMQIQVAHALCERGCRLIRHTNNKRLAAIEACYNCPRSPPCPVHEQVICILAWHAPIMDNTENNQHFNVLI